MKARAFEKAVWEIERIRIVIHAPNGTELDDYTYEKAATKNWSIKELGEKRIAPCLNAMTYAVIQGNGKNAHGGASVQTVRDSYAE
ncbi:hypothetical protein ACMX25_12325 [Caballeronia sp. 15715]|uniref:hypothetical protein n=1 Tax=Caballeronia sp. 15715 TaxID=3391030 RepID=UPI0039E44FA3